jgi:hypothetical protein
MKTTLPNLGLINELYTHISEYSLGADGLAEELVRDTVQVALKNALFIIIHILRNDGLEPAVLVTEDYENGETKEYVAVPREWDFSDPYKSPPDFSLEENQYIKPWPEVEDYKEVV